jgi:hypothetical protein
MFLSEGNRTGKLATVQAEGRPHVTPIWFVLDGDDHRHGGDCGLEDRISRLIWRAGGRTGKIHPSLVPLFLIRAARQTHHNPGDEDGRQIKFDSGC